MHVALRIAYDGSQFHAYARDGELHTVERSLLKAIAKEGFREGSFKTGSRTDGGVSAVENVVSFQLEHPQLRGLVHRIQNHLPEGLWATAATEVPDEFIPRYHALRAYEYFAPKRGENLKILQEACAIFQGEHDMSGFARVESHRNPVRQITTCQVEDAENFWKFTIASPGFLWNQVRRMVDAMLRVGRGQMPLEAIQKSLENGEPNAGFKLAPAEGLLLRSVTYPDLEWDPQCGMLEWDRLQKRRQTAKVLDGLISTLSDKATKRQH